MKKEKKDKINLLKIIKSKYVLKLIMDNIKENKLLKIIKYNKNIQDKLEIDINNYKDTQIQIDIFPIEIENKNIFINFQKKDEKYFHIYFDNQKEETKKNYFLRKKCPKKIKVIIDYKINSFNGLFKNCECIIKINFILFKRDNLIDMSEMFYDCYSLGVLNINNFNTSNVINMTNMFCNCPRLGKLNLNSFNTKNVINMEGMFWGCSAINDLNISNFNTNKVSRIDDMFRNCYSLKNLFINRMNAKEIITFAKNIFYGCSKIKIIMN